MAELRAFYKFEFLEVLRVQATYIMTHINDCENAERMKHNTLILNHKKPNIGYRECTIVGREMLALMLYWLVILILA
jgi:hypothetical protein